MTNEQTEALLHALDALWVYGADSHPSVERTLVALRQSFGYPARGGGFLNVPRPAPVCSCGDTLGDVDPRCPAHFPSRAL